MIDHQEWINAKQTSMFIIFKLKIFAILSINLSKYQKLTDHEVKIISNLYLEYIGVI
jgi:hypothetical protein